MRATKWAVSATLVVTDDGTLDADELESHVDRVMEELAELEAEPDLTASLGKGIVEIEIVVKARTVQEAWQAGLVTIRCALHAAGASTPDWPTLDDMGEPHADLDGTWVVTLRGTATRDPRLALT